MKITSTTNNSAINTVSTTRATSGAASGAHSPGKNAVELSPAARQLASLQNSDNDVNLERVQEIRDAIASGKLKVDTGRIADSLLVSVRDLLK